MIEGTMGTNSDVESCGRCSMSMAVDVSNGDGTNPWAGERIEIAESEMQAASRHVVALGRLKRRLDEWATRLTFGR
ncbi:MAG: hypothetical protein ABEJ55_05210 [Halanaeroarchaeum sp.]